ncbi:MAG: RnfH family Ubiquitin, partial [Proteobacteria bacterium]|nr:RnfH family Ubiquitin [Pseudomonadota bacterium]
EFVRLDECLHGGERVEIYRALIADPKEARRRRAQAKKRR